MIRSLFRFLSLFVIVVLKPFKLYAYRTRFSLVRQAILTVTEPLDFAMIWVCIQNETMLLHAKVYGGNFLFGNAIMVVDYKRARAAIERPLFKNRNFMGVKIVSSDSDVFSTGAPILQQNPPIRQLSRQYIDRHIFTQPILALTTKDVLERCEDILTHWKQDPKMANTFAIRSTVIQFCFKILADVTLPKAEADKITFNYMRRFVEASLFNGYLPFMNRLLGTSKKIREDVYFKLTARGIDNQTIDMVLFAALFSVGTLVIRCAEDARRFGIVYRDLEPTEKRHFIIEAVRLYPTVTTVHRMLEQPETVIVAGKELNLTPGDEVAYPIICCNRDPEYFTNPKAMDLHRTAAEYERVLSWSKGPHDCPGKKLSLVLVEIMLDALAEKKPLAQYKIFNPAF